MTEIPVFRTFVPPRARARAAEAMSRGWIGYGPECRALEARFVHGRGGFALATSSCTSALYLAALASGRGPAPEVIVPSITFVATAMAFHHAGYRVRLAGVDPCNLMPTREAVLPLINAATTALVVVHLYGQHCPQMPALRHLCDERGLALVEDCAHRLDVLDASAPLGDYACYSFNAVKELPGGEGGLLWSRDPAGEHVARSASNVGLALDTMQRAASTRHADYAFTKTSGLKLRSNDLAASLVNACFDYLEEWRAHRREQFARYDRLLAPLQPHVRLLPRADDDACLMYVIRVAAPLREAVRRELARHGVATSVHYPSLVRHPLFQPEGAAAPVDGVDDELVTLPTFLQMTPGQQEFVAERLERALEALAGPCPSRAAAA